MAVVRRKGQFGERGFGTLVIIILLGIAAAVGAMIVTGMLEQVPEFLSRVVDPLLSGLG